MNSNQLNRLFVVNWLLGCCLVLLLLVSSGCVTKPEANARARAAYMAGRQEGMTAQSQSQGPTVQIVGDVKTHVVPWTEDLTLIHALLAAEYQGIGNPSQITVVRNGQLTYVEPNRLLRGEDMPLQAGDRVEIRP